MNSLGHSKMLTKKIACLVILLGLFVGLASAMSGGHEEEEVFYHHSYDDGSRTPLMQLYDGLQIENFIIHAKGNDEIGSFLPNPTELQQNPGLKNVVRSLISTTNQITVLEEVTPNPTTEAVVAILHEVMEDGCAYLQSALKIQDGLNCTLSELTSIKNRIELADRIMKTRKLILEMLPTGTSISVDDTCAFWNNRILKNCTVQNDHIFAVQNTLLAPIQRLTKKCQFCSTETK